MKIRQEKGSVSVLVIVTILFFIIVLTAVYIAISNAQTIQVKEIQRIKEIYEKNLGNLDDIYATYQESKLYIYTKEELIEFKNRVNSGISYEGKIVYLMNDINLNEGKYTENEDGTITFADDAEKWESINGFKGTFDGMNYSILGLCMENEQTMFEDVIEETTIKNLKIEKSNSIQDTQLLGIVKEDSGKIINCYNSANLLYKIPYIPEGFEWIEGTIYTGIIIKNKVTEDEFVWVPVETPIAEDQTELENLIKEGKYPMAVKTEGQDVNEIDNYKGVVYNFELNEKGDGVNITVSEDSQYTEPSNLTETITIDNELYVYDSQEMYRKQNAGTWSENLYQEEYNELISSVIKNRGFYIGRYESGDLNQSKAVSKLKASNIGGQTWYKMYNAQKNIYGEGSNIKTHMIWGSQWDQILIWMKDIINTSENSFYILNSIDMGVHLNNKDMIYDGTTGKFQTKNIYDFAGNVWERTMEASGTNNRVNRGGSSYEEGLEMPVSYRDNRYSPNESFDNVGSRLTLYIK